MPKQTNKKTTSQHIIFKLQKIKDKEKLTHWCTLGGNINWHSHAGNSGSFSTPRTEPPGDPAERPRADTQAAEALTWKETGTLVFTEALFTSAKMRKQPNVQNQMIDREDVVHVRARTHTHTHTGILLSREKEWTFVICSNMYGLGGHYAKWSQTEKDKYWMISLTCGI